MEHHEKPPIRNAASERQVQKGKDKERRLEERLSADLRAVLSTTSGRRVMWRLLEECKTFESIWEPSAKIHYLAGRQDLGHFILAIIEKASVESLFQMMKEKKDYDDV